MKKSQRHDESDLMLYVNHLMYNIDRLMQLFMMYFNEHLKEIKQTLSLLIRRYFYYHGLFCASHPLIVMPLVIAIIVLCSLPAVRLVQVYTPVQQPVQWNDDLFDTHNNFTEMHVLRYGRVPLLRVRDIIILPRVPSAPSCLDGMISPHYLNDTFLIHSSMEAFTVRIDDRDYSLRDFCVYDGKKCALVSPLSIWGGNVENAHNDRTPRRTIANVIRRVPHLSGSFIGWDIGMVAFESSMWTWFMPLWQSTTVKEGENTPHTKDDDCLDDDGTTTAAAAAAAAVTSLSVSVFLRLPKDLIDSSSLKTQDNRSDQYDYLPKSAFHEHSENIEARFFDAMWHHIQHELRCPDPNNISCRSSSEAPRLYGPGFQLFDDDDDDDDDKYSEQQKSGDDLRRYVDEDLLSSKLHIFFEMPLQNSVIDNGFLIFSYAIVFLYISFSLGRFHLVKSKFGLGLTGVCTVFFSMTMSVGICMYVGIRPTLMAFEVTPFLIMAIGVENIFVITNAVVSTSPDLPVRRRIALGMAEVGVSILTPLFSEQVVFLLCVLSTIKAIREFGLLASVGVLADFFLQITFFTTVLSIDIRRMELSDLHHPHSRSRTGSVLRKSQSPGKKQKLALTSKPMRSLSINELGSELTAAVEAVAIYQNSSERFSQDERFRQNISLPSSLLSSPLSESPPSSEVSTPRPLHDIIGNNFKVPHDCSTIEAVDSLNYRDTLNRLLCNPFVVQTSIALASIALVSLGLYNGTFGGENVKTVGINIRVPSMRGDDAGLLDVLLPEAEQPAMTAALWSWLGSLRNVTHPDLTLQSYYIDLLPPIVASMNIPHTTIDHIHSSKVQQLTSWYRIIASIIHKGIGYTTQWAFALAQMNAAQVPMPIAVGIVLLCTYFTVTAISHVFRFIVTMTSRLYINERAPYHIVEQNSSASNVKRRLYRSWATIPLNVVAAWSLPGHIREVECLRSSDTNIISASLDGSVRVWSAVGNSPCIHSMLISDGAVWCLEFVGDIVVAGGGSGSVCAWSASSGSELLREPRAHSDGVTCLGICLVASTIIVLSGSEDGVLRGWLVYDGVSSERGISSRALWRSSHRTSVTALVAMHDRVAAGSRDGSLQIHDVRSGDILVCLFGHSACLTVLHVLDDMSLISGAQNGAIKIWDFETGACKRKLHSHSEAITCITSRGDIAVTASADGSVFAHHAPSGRRLLNVTTDGKSDGDKSEIRSVACPFDVVIHPITSELVIGGRNCIRIWDIRSGNCVRTLLLSSKTGEHALLQRSETASRCGGAEVSRVSIAGDARIVCDYGCELAIIDCPSWGKKVA